MTEQEKKTEQMRRFATVEERRALAGRIAAGGAVLLKNEGNLLPFSGSTRVAVFGRTQINTIKGGTGSANCDCEYTVSFLDGIRGAGIPVDEHLADVYRTWTAAHPIPSFGVWGSGMHCAPEMSLDDTILADAEKNADAAIVVIGRTAGENEDVAFGEGDWYLSADERNMLGAVVSRFPGRTAVLVNSGGLIDFSFADTFGVSALLLCFMPGMEGARAIGDILAGRVTPSGKLTATVAKNYEDYPSAGHFGQTGGGIIQDYVEDVYVGYRYFLTFAKEKIRYPFGFGLSYTTFELSDCSASEENGVITVSCRVTNTGGTYSGREVAQVYFSSPQPEDGAKLYRPRRVLAGFAKTKTLLPGENETVTVSFPLSDLASFDDTGVTDTATALSPRRATIVSSSETLLLRTPKSFCITRRKRCSRKRSPISAPRFPRACAATGAWKHSRPFRSIPGRDSVSPRTERPWFPRARSPRPIRRLKPIFPHSMRDSRSPTASLPVRRADIPSALTGTLPGASRTMESCRSAA